MITWGQNCHRGPHALTGAQVCRYSSPTSKFHFNHWFSGNIALDRGADLRNKGQKLGPNVNIVLRAYL